MGYTCIWKKMQSYMSKHVDFIIYVNIYYRLEGFKFKIRENFFYLKETQYVYVFFKLNSIDQMCRVLFTVF